MIRWPCHDLRAWLEANTTLASGFTLLLLSWLAGVFRPPGLNAAQRCVLALDSATSGALAAGAIYWWQGCIQWSGILFAALVLAGGRPLQSYIIGLLTRRFLHLSDGDPPWR